VVKQRTERNLLFPSKEFRDRVRLAPKERGFRSEQAFILAACKNELAGGLNLARVGIRLPQVVWQTDLWGLTRNGNKPH
jgi:hypothetical protein